MPSDFRSDDMLPVLPPEFVNAPRPQLSFDALLPKPKNLQLTSDQVTELAAFEAAFIILGPAGGAVLQCPGNQENLLPEQKCPYWAKCPLLRVKKAPAGELCPIERALTEQRFSGWCQTINTDPIDLDEVARYFVSEMVWTDIQTHRCTNILSTGEAARLTQVNMTEAINFTDAQNNQQVLPLTWERVLHVNTQRLNELHERQHSLLKAWMLTPEQKWKIARAEGKPSGNDLGSKQASRGDKLRKLDPAFE